ncbi:MAG: DUF1794 domain-containing protein [Gammaproteobacteria bacterium]|nr:MAG: DUF1794 domain-containing protein [Gammaproteobacteria bacterium]
MSETVIDGVDYGPLACLIGNWKGDKGVDKAPEPDGEERNLFYETILYEACGDVENGQKQIIAIVRYHQVVKRKSNDEVFHNETGYWGYDKATGQIMQSLTIPRGLALLAGGKASTNADGETVLEVKAVDGDKDWGIVQSPFMRDNARTKQFTHSVFVKGDQMRYSESTLLDIYGREYDHTDINRLTRA